MPYDNYNTDYLKASGDFYMLHAVEETQRKYDVTIVPNAKSVLKFGWFDDLGTSSETVQRYGGNETFLTTNAITSLSSSSDDDTEEMVVIGHTVAGTGVDAKFTEVTQTVTLTGQTDVDLATPLARVSRVYVNSTTALAGDVYVHEGQTTVAGVPDTAAEIHMKIEGSSGDTQSYKAATTVSDKEFLLLTSCAFSVEKKKTSVTDFVLEQRIVGGVFRPIFRASVSTGSQHELYLRPHIIIPQNSDVRVTATSSSADTGVNASFSGVYFKIS